MTGFKFKCTCGYGRFLIVSEKSYDGSVDAEGVLVCLAQSEFIRTIACAKCGKTHDEGEFRGIEY